MTERVRFRPFTGDSERRVEMKRAPLALVLVQVRWPDHGRFALDFKRLALAFGEGLDDFPLFQEVVEQQAIQFTPEGVQTIQGESSYQWRSIDDLWTVQLTKSFMSLYCAPHDDYKFAELAERLSYLTQRLHDVLKIRVTERIGVRYVNRLSEPHVMPELPSIFDGAVLGMSGLPKRPGVELVNTLSQAVYSVEDLSLHVRSGYLGPGETMDPAIGPVALQSWVLDLDASETKRRVFQPDEVLEVVGRLADVAYDFFKMVLKDSGELRLDGRS